MSESQFTLLLGMTGVGKTTVIEKLRAITYKDINRISYGSILLEEARSRDFVASRDELTSLEPEAYNELQWAVANEVASRVGKTQTAGVETVHILDTHALLDTPYGYRPGFSQGDMSTMEPDQIIYLKATPGEIHERRISDDSRERDVTSVPQLREQQERAIETTMALATATRSPVKIVQNNDGELETAASEISELYE